MNDRMKESLSALVDGQADELEIRRLLNSSEDSDEFRDTWNRYQMMGALMRDEPVSAVDLSKGIMQAIAGEPMDDVPVIPQVSGSDVQGSEAVHHSSSSLRNWMTSGAIAASVAVAVLMGVRISDDLGSSAQSVASVASSTEVQRVSPAANDGSQPAYILASSGSVDTLDNETSIVVDEETLKEAQQRLQDYFMQHSEQNAGSGAVGLMPYVRVTSFEQDGQGNR